MKFPWRRHALPPPPEGYADYWASLDVRLHTPIPVEHDEDDEDDEVRGPMVGYIRNFGVRARRDELIPLLERTVEEGTIRWETSEWYPVDPDRLERIVRRRIVPVDPSGVWYVSGRAFFPDDPEDGGDSGDSN